MFDDWTPVRSSSGGFQATFPNQPEGTTESNFHNGDEVRTTLWTAETDDFACTVGIVEFMNYNPEADPRAVLQGALSGVIGELSGNLERQLESEHGGKPSLDAVVTFDEGWAALRMVSNESKLFYAQVLGEAPQEDVFSFFADSFQLI